jgi:hypothetical protein
MSIAALSCSSSQLGGFTYGAVVGRAGSSLAAVTLALEMDDHSLHCLNRSSPTSSTSSSSHFLSEITRYKLALLQQQQQQHGGSVVVVAGQQNGSVEPRLADENNYMLRSGAAAAAAASASGGVQCSVSAAGTVVVAGSASGGQSLECQPIPAAAAAVVSRPRSASLSLVSRLSSPCRHPTHSHPPTPPPLHLGDSASAAPLLLARVKIPAATAAPAASTSLLPPAPYSRLLCACLPTCCCDCNLLSSIAECQAVYHQACARYIGSNSTTTASEPANSGCCSSSVSSITTGTSEAAFNDVPSPTLPQTVPQDVVSLSLSLSHSIRFLLFLIFLKIRENLFRSLREETKDA